MTTKDEVRSTVEALKMALEALEECRRDPRLKYEHPYYDKAIAAIRVALASKSEALMSVPDGAQSRSDEEQPARIATSGYAKKIESLINERESLKSKLAERPAQHTEPCGWRMKHNGEWAYSFTEDAWDFIYAVSPAARKAARDNAPASKPWVGLTDEEGHRVVNNCKTGSTREIFRAIESKLKEKNGF